ncbi:MAG: hypothetical protein ACRDFB_09470 [Rhabdochlamydiaceae bacterium]
MKRQNKMLSCKEVKRQIAAQMTDRKKGISVSIWQPEDSDMDRIVIKFPRNFTDYVGLTWLNERILEKNGFHVAQVMGFMEDKKLWLLLVRDRR